MNIRLVICIDIDDAKSLEDAYEQVYDKMNSLPKDTSWESSDEFFIDGEPGDPEVLQGARMKVIGRKNPQ